MAALNDIQTQLDTVISLLEDIKTNTTTAGDNTNDNTNDNTVDNT